MEMRIREERQAQEAVSKSACQSNSYLLETGVLGDRFDEQRDLRRPYPSVSFATGLG